MTQLDEGTTAPVVGDQGVRSKQRLTPKRLVLTFVAVLAGTVGGTLIAKSIGNGDHSGGMTQWMASYGATYLAVSRDVATVNNATSSASLRRGCVHLAADVQTARDDPPMPLSSLENPWSSILRDLQLGTHACVAGVDQQSRSSVNRAVRDFGQAETQYLQLVKAVNAANP